MPLSRLLFPKQVQKTVSSAPSRVAVVPPEREKEAPYKGSCRMARESFLFEICKTSCSQVEVYLSSSSSTSAAFALLFLRTFFTRFFFVGRVCSSDHYLLCQAKYASVYAV